MFNIMGDEHEVNTKIEEDYLYLQIIPLNKTDDYVVHTPDKDNNLNYWSYDTLHLAILDGDFKLSLDKFSRKQMDELFLLDKYEIITLHVSSMNFSLKRYNYDEEKDRIVELLEDISRYRNECNMLYIIGWRTFLWEKPFIEQKVIQFGINYYSEDFPEDIRFIDFKMILGLYKSGFNSFGDWMFLFFTGKYGSGFDKKYDRLFNHLWDLKGMVDVFVEGKEIGVNECNGYTNNNIKTWYIWEKNNRFEDQYEEWRWNYNNTIRRTFFNVLNVHMNNILSFKVETYRKYNVDNWAHDLYQLKHIFRIDYKPEFIETTIANAIDNDDYIPELLSFPYDIINNKAEINKIKQNINHESYFFYKCFIYGNISINLYRYLYSKN